MQEIYGHKTVCSDVNICPVVSLDNILGMGAGQGIFTF